MTSPRPDRIVQVFTPTSAPHLSRIAADIEREVLRQMDALTPDALRHLLRVGAEIARARDEYDRFRRRIAVK